MSNPQKTPAIRVQTPFGIAAYPHLNKPDEYKPKGSTVAKIEYKATIFMNMTDPGVAEFVQKVEDIAQDFFNQKTSEFKPKPGKKRPEFKLYTPIKREYAEDGETPTGRISVTAKMAASYTDKSGVEIPMAPGLFDAAGNRIDPNKTAIWGGSEMRLQVKMVPFLNDATGDAGATIKLEQVQIRKLRSGGSGQCAFGAVDGDVIDDSDDSTPSFSGKTAAASSTVDGDQEF